MYPNQKNKDDSYWVDKTIHAANEQEVDLIFKEGKVWFKCSHPSLVPIQEWSIKKLGGSKYKVAYELSERLGTLKEKRNQDLKNRFCESKQQIIKLLYSLVCSLGYLHKRNIPHQEISPESIMYSEEEDLKLCARGIPRSPSEEEKSEERSFAYTAPELKNHEQGKQVDLYKADVWSLALVIMELCLKQQGIYTFGEDVVQKRLKIKEEELIQIYDDKLIRLLFEMLDFDPEKRKTLEETKLFLEENYSVITGCSQKAKLREDELIRAREDKEFDQNEKVREGKPEENDQFNERKILIQELEESQIQSTMEAINLSLQELVIEGMENLTDDGIKTLAKEIGQFKFLGHLSLNFKENLNITDTGVGALVEQIRDLESLTSLSLNFERSLNITDTGVRKLVEGIKIPLQILSLKFAE